MKKILFIAVFIVSTLSFSQSNDKGIIHISLQGGYIFYGTVTDKPECDGCMEQKSNFGSLIYGLNIHYGISEKVSLGAGFNTGKYNLIDEDFENSLISQKISLSTATLQGRYYFVNEYELNYFGGINIGYGFTTDDFGDFNTAGAESTASGLTYGIRAGVSYYKWGDLGIIAQLGYDRATLSGDFTDVDNTFEFDRNIGSFISTIGLTYKIN